jgi:hypothetical protein
LILIREINVSSQDGMIVVRPVYRMHYRSIHIMKNIHLSISHNETHFNKIQYYKKIEKKMIMLIEFESLKIYKTEKKAK